MIYTTIKNVRDEWAYAKKCEEQARDGMLQYLKSVTTYAGPATIKLADKYIMVATRLTENDEKAEVVIYEQIVMPKDAKMYAADYLRIVCEEVHKLHLVEEWKEEEWDKEEENNKQ